MTVMPGCLLHLIQLLLLLLLLLLHVHSVVIVWLRLVRGARLRLLLLIYSLRHPRRRLHRLLLLRVTGLLVRVCVCLGTACPLLLLLLSLAAMG